VNGIIDLILKRLRPICDIDQFLSGPPTDRYHQALEVLKAYLEDPTQLIRRAVLMDRSVEDPSEIKKLITQGDLNSFYTIERDVENWHLAPGLAAFGKIIAGEPEIFGKVVLTSNFDPLIEISVRRAGGEATSIGIDSDASPDIVAPSSACRVLHFHGLWSGSGTLHRPDQLKQNRPLLFDAICGYLRKYTCVVLAYGGWDDIFIKAVHCVLSSRNASPTILWAHFNGDPEEVKRQRPSILGDLDRLAVSRDGFIPYYGIDVNEFLPRLFDLLGRPGPHRRQPRVPSADERVQPPARRVLAFAAQDDAYSAPYYPDSLWGTDRGRFLGLMNASTDVGAYESLVQTEGRIQSQIQSHPELSGLPVRWWLRLDASRLTSRSNASEAIEYAVADSYDPRFQYMRSYGLPRGVQLGAFLDMPRFMGTNHSVELLGRCVECIESAVDRLHLFGIVARWFQVPVLDFSMVLEKSKRVWSTLAVDGLNLVEEYATTGKGAYDNSKQFRERLSDDRSDDHQTELLGGEARAVEMYAQGKLSEETFVREYGIRTFALALRRGLAFPTAVAISSQIDLSCADFWWLVTKLEPSPSRLSDILSLTASRRAVWGLCSLKEWSSFESYIQAQILDVRQGRPLVLE
jgi:hypothetical protein